LQKLKEKGVLLVGHEPHLSGTISLLLFGREQSVVEMRKCSLACVSATPPIGKGGAVLRWLLTSELTMKK
jgi:phosphohistidine phosphatase SixA